MPTRFNTDHQPQVLSWQEPAVMPGDSHEFTDEEIAAGLPSCWSETDPRAGLEGEKRFKAKRDAKGKGESTDFPGQPPAEQQTTEPAAPAPDAQTPTEPAQSGDKE